MSIEELEILEDEINNRYFYKTRCKRCGELERHMRNIPRGKHICKEDRGLFKRIKRILINKG